MKAKAVRNTKYLVIVFHNNEPILGPLVIEADNDGEAALEVLKGNMSHLLLHYDTNELQVLVMLNRSAAEVMCYEQSDD